MGTGGQVPSARLVQIGQHFDKSNRMKCFCEVMHRSSRRWKEREGRSGLVFDRLGGGGEEGMGHIWCPGEESSRSDGGRLAAAKAEVDKWKFGGD